MKASWLHYINNNNKLILEVKTEIYRSMSDENCLSSPRRRFTIYGTFSIGGVLEKAEDHVINFGLSITHLEDLVTSRVIASHNN